MKKNYILYLIYIKINFRKMKVNFFIYFKYLNILYKRLNGIPKLRLKKNQNFKL